MYCVSILNSTQAPLPLVNTFTVPSDSAGEQVLLVSGAAFTENPNSMLQVDVVVGNNVVDTLQVFSNGKGTGRAFPTLFIPVRLAPGTYTFTLRIRPGSSTLADGSCYFNAMLLA